MSEDDLSLYFKLKPNEKADLEVVAEAAIHWVAALRAAAQVLDPGSTVRVEVIDAQESSLKINTVLGWIEKKLERHEKGLGRYPRLKKLAIALAIFVPTTGIPTYYFYFGDDPVLNLSEEDRKRLDELIEQTRKVPEVENRRSKFFRTLERDRSISDVGVTEGRDRPPAVLVPSKDFAIQSGLWAIQEEQAERTLNPVLDVTLVAPQLVAKPRSWIFRPEGLPEFSAKMKDMKFLAALQQQYVKETLRIGIPMTIRLEVKEQKINGEWVVKKGGRSVVEVISPKVD